jgi:poly [ADP-ribose] polymerase 2/3/4
MATITKKIRLIYSEVGENSNKVWEGELYDDSSVITRWGRVGNTLDSKTFPNAGEVFLLKKQKEKEKKGYTILKTLGEGIEVKSAPVSNLHEIAMAQIAKNNPELSKILERLSKANVHNITSQTNITYNSATGLFQTPLGIITQEGIDEARNLLVNVKKAMIDAKKKEMEKLTSGYLRLIPQKVGTRLTVESVFPDLDAVQKQADILDSLEASLKSVTTVTTTDKTKSKIDLEKVFAVDMDVLKDAQEQRRLEDFYQKSMKSMHGYNHIKIRQMFKVNVNEMDLNFDTKLGNNVEVYHGTSQANLLSILKSGLKTSPPSTAFIAGKMFGNGIYGAVNSSKSLGYTFGRWGGSAAADSGWLFVCDFAMGKVYEPSSTCNGPASGHDSVWAKASKVGLNHDELIIYRNNQVRIKYLLECK